MWRQTVWSLPGMTLGLTRQSNLPLAPKMGQRVKRSDDAVGQ
jgi:hypothetical protein